MILFKRLLDFAKDNDGECIVAKVADTEDDYESGWFNTQLFRTDDSIIDSPNCSEWDYFFADEPECFPYEDYNIERPKDE